MSLHFPLPHLLVLLLHLLISGIPLFSPPLVYLLYTLAFKPASCRGTEFCNPPPIPVLRYGREYAFYLDASCFTDTRSSDRALTVPDCHIVLRDTDDGAWVRCWLHCDGCGMSVSRCVSIEVDCPFVHCYREVEYERDLSTLVHRFDRQPLPEMGPSFVFLCRPFSHLHFHKRFDYWACDCDFEHRLCLHARGILASWHDFELFAIPPLHRPSHYRRTPGWAREFEGSRLLGASTPMVFAYYSGYTLKHHPRQDLV